MSGNRSVQAAQRRRAGPINEQSNQIKSPQLSINSSQVFSNQTQLKTNQQNGRSTNNIPPQINNDKLTSVSKMTIPQAITLITLRLGAIESKLLNMNEDGNPICGNMQSEIDPSLFKSIITRLENLEKRAGAMSDLNILKQNYENIKQLVSQLKTTTLTLVKENNSLKTQIEDIKNELTETQTMLTNLHQIKEDDELFDLPQELNMNNELLYENENIKNELNDELENDELENENNE